jgi:hypothetical protein
VIYRAAQQLHWRFFVLSSNGDSTPDGSRIDSATNDLEQLKCWARQRPRWALATGSGVLVLEVDSAEGGQDSLLELCRDDWGWLDTLRSSAGFKRYIFFRCLDPLRQLNGFGHIGKGRRGHGITTPEEFEALDQAVAVGRGQVWLELSDAQYQALRLSKSGVAL